MAQMYVKDLSKYFHLTPVRLAFELFYLTYHCI